MFVWLECPHCHVKMRTRKIVRAGDVVQCPRCDLFFHLLPDDASLVETIPVLHDGGTSMREQAPIPRIRNWETEEVPTQPVVASGHPAPSPQKRPARRRLVSFEQSRRTVATFIFMVIGGLVTLFLYWYVNTVRALDRTVTAASRQRVSQAERLVKAGLSTAKNAKAKTLELPQSDRTTAPAASQIGDTVVGIPNAEVSTIWINNREGSTRYLVLTTRVTNLSPKPLAFVGWHSGGVAATLRDNSRNYFNFIKFKAPELPKGCVERVDVQPGETVTDILVFEAPTALLNNMWIIPPTLSFELDLPLDGKVFRFIIPGPLIKRPAPTLVARPVSPTPPPAPVPAQAPSPPSVEEQVLADYKRSWAQAARAAKAKSSSRASEYLRARKQEIISELAKKYGISRSDVKGIIPL